MTYDKHPLYTFALDKQAGQTNGEGSLAFAPHWYGVSAKGTAVLKAATSTGTTTTAPTPQPVGFRDRLAYFLAQSNQVRAAYFDPDR